MIEKWSSEFSDEDKPRRIIVNGNTIEKVIYLGQLFTSDGRCIKEIIRRIQIAR